MNLSNDLRPLIDTPDRFRDWLLSAESDGVVGARGCAGHCPIAYFLTAAGLGGGYDNADVEQDHIHVWFCEDDYKAVTPQWAIDFIERLDPRPGSIDVTAAEALEVLSLSVLATPFVEPDPADERAA